MMKKIDNIGIVGAGSMGAGIAQVAAMAGYTVYLYDQNKETVKSALDKLDAILNRLIEKHRISKEEKEQTLKCITGIKWGRKIEVFFKYFECKAEARFKHLFN